MAIARANHDIDMVLEDVTELYGLLRFVMSPLTKVQRLLRKPHEALQDSSKREQHLHGKKIFQADSVILLIPGSVGAGWRRPRCGSAMIYGTWDAAAFR
jgi:hypothetical protein